MNKKFLPLVLALSVLVLNPLPANAQSPCTDTTLVIINESTQKLDREALCTEATPWIVNQKINVYVWLTDLKTGSENEWFGVLDKKEISLGLRTTDGKSFHKSSTMFAATTATNLWGRNHDYGEVVLTTPYEKNAEAKRSIKQDATNLILAGKATEGFAQWMREVYKVAFPPPPPTLVPKPTAVPQPTAEIAPTKAPVPQSPPLSEPDRPKTEIPWGLILTVVVLVGGGGALFVFVIVPWQKQQAIIARKRTQLARIMAAVDRMANIAEEVLRPAEQSQFMEVALTFGLGSYKEMLEQMTGLVQLAREVHAQALEKALQLKRAMADPTKRKKFTVDGWIASWSLLYLSYLGRAVKLHEMTAEALRDFIDPFATEVMTRLSEMDQRPLMAQIQAIPVPRDERESPLLVDLVAVDDSKVSEDGVFGVVKKIKEIISKLARAQNEAQPRLDEAKETRARVANLMHPKDLKPEVSLAAVDAMISQADAEVQQKLWLLVLEHAEAARALAGQIEVLLPKLVAVVTSYEQRLAATDRIAQRGFRLAFYDESAKKCRKIVSTMYARVEKGEVSSAERSVGNLDEESKALLANAQALVELYERNQKRLQELSVEVARVDQYREKTVEPAWQPLRAYPESNWRDVGKYDEAVVTINRLFDDPSIAKDLTSEIGNLNGIDKQKFAEAEQMLIQAFADLRVAETQLKDIVERLVVVQQVEKTIGQTVETARSEIAKAKTRRDQDDKFIDAEVDAAINEASQILTVVIHLITTKEFTEANARLAIVRKTANDAYTSADQQAQKISGLLADLERVRASAESVVTNALSAQNALVAAAQKAGTSGLCANTQDALKAAKRAEANIKTLEDRALASALATAIGGYKDAESQARKALSQVKADKDEYDNYHFRARDAIRSAGGSINTARRYVQDNDSGGAGRTSLSQAENAVPNEPEYGASKQALGRVVSQAESAEQLADRAAEQAKRAIREAEEERERERQRQAAIEAARRARERAEEEARDAARRASEYAASSSRQSDFGFSSSRGSNFGAGGRA